MLDLPLQEVPPAEINLKITVRVLLLQVYPRHPATQLLAKHPHAETNPFRRVLPQGECLAPLCHFSRIPHAPSEEHPGVVAQKGKSDDDRIFPFVDQLPKQPDEALVRQKEGVLDGISQPERQQMHVPAPKGRIVSIGREKLGKNGKVALLYRWQSWPVGCHRGERARLHELVDDEQIVEADELERVVVIHPLTQQ